MLFDPDFIDSFDNSILALEAEVCEPGKALMSWLVIPF